MKNERRCHSNAAQFFETWEQLRQHEVDCKDENGDNQL